MKKSMTDYLYALSENSYDNLYEIMSTKYRKFLRIYWLLKEFSDNITGLKYKEKSEKDRLKITVTFSGLDATTVSNKLRERIDDSDEIYIEVNKNNIDIEIHKTESDI